MILLMIYSGKLLNDEDFVFGRLTYGRFIKVIFNRRKYPTSTQHHRGASDTFSPQQCRGDNRNSSYICV